MKDSRELLKFVNLSDYKTRILANDIFKYYKSYLYEMLWISLSSRTENLIPSAHCPSQAVLGLLAGFLT